MSRTVFISYSKSDVAWKEQIREYLESLEFTDDAEIWSDEKIDGGEEWYPEIREAIGRSAVGILLVTRNFLRTSFILNEEVPELLQRRSDLGLKLIPIVLEECPWGRHRWLKKLELVPEKAKPLNKFSKKDQGEFLSRLTEEIGEFLEDWTDSPADDGYEDAAARPLPALPTTSSRPTVAEATRSGSGGKAPKPVVDISHLPQTGLTLFGRDEQLNQLDEIWEQASYRVVSYVAAGGVGKSSLVNKWMSEFAKDDYRGARRVYGWSFYSQGTRDQITSADAFLDQALRFFGDEKPESGSPWDKGERLADLIATERTLIVLDGMEPLQSGHDVDKGKLRDPGLQAFLIRLVQTESQSLCVVTTRESVTDLHNLKPVESLLSLITRSVSEETAPEDSPEKPFLEVPLDTITHNAGRALLRHTRVVGTDEELATLATEFGPHALTVLLLGAWLHQTPGHKASNAKELQGEGDPLDRVLAGFEKLLGEGPELQLLRLLGLFDRPASAAELAAIAAGDRIPGLTDHLVPLENVEEIEANPDDGHWGPWQPWLSKLRDLHLVVKHCHARPDEIDAHPLIREFFASRLAEGRGEEERSEGDQASSPLPSLTPHLQEAHRRLYEHLKQSAPERPDNLNDMMPLFHSIRHAVNAGLDLASLNDVFSPRIRQRNAKISWRKLGAFGLELSCMSGFFEKLWSDLYAGLDDYWTWYVLDTAGFALRSIGRLEESIKPMTLAAQVNVRSGNWKFGAALTSNLSELSLTLGEVSSAVRQGEQSVELADRSGDAFQRMSKRTTLAAALFCAGVTRWQGDREREPNALASGLSASPRETPAASAVGSPAHLAFREAEAMQQEMQPQYPLLYSVQGYQYCELLLADVCLRIGNLLAGSRPDQAQRSSGISEESERQGARRRSNREPVQEEPAPGALPLTKDNVTEGAPAALRSVRPAGDGLSELQSEIESLRNRAEKWFEWRVEDDSILDTGLAHLTLGRTWQLSARLERARSSGLSPSSPVASSEPEPSEPGPDREIPVVAESPYSQAEHHLSQSVTLLRQSGLQDELPRGLLHRAALWREMLALAPSPWQGEGWGEGRGDNRPEGGESGEDSLSHPSPDLSPQGERDFYALAERDLSEAESIADRGSMLIFQIEAALERTRLFLAIHAVYPLTESQASRCLALAEEKLNETRELIAQTESTYEPHVSDWDKWEPPEYVGVFEPGEKIGYHCQDDEIELVQQQIDSLKKAD